MKDDLNQLSSSAIYFSQSYTSKQPKPKSSLDTVKILEVTQKFTGRRSAVSKRSEGRSGPRHSNGQPASGDSPRDTVTTLGNDVSRHTGYNGTQYLRPQVN